MKHNEWIKKSKSDLNSAKVLFKENFLDTSIYHTQQSAEKALKAYLVFKEIQIKKSHDLIFLVEECKKINNRFEILFEMVGTLNPYSTEFRYPDEYLSDPDKQTVLEAINYAEKILKFVQDLIKDEITGQKNITDYF